MWHSLGQELLEPLDDARWLPLTIGSLSSLLQYCDGFQGVHCYALEVSPK